MAEEREYFATAASFGAGIVAGILANTLASTLACFHTLSPPTIMLVTTLASALLLERARGRGMGTVLPIALICMFFCGIFCSTSSGITAWATDTSRPSYFTGLRQAVLSIPFKDDKSNALLLALTCGDRSLLSPEIRGMFRNSGAAHILALSGLHLGLICLLLDRMLALLGNSPAATRARCMTTMAACGAYAWITGASPSIMRAFLFICVREWCVMSGRKSSTGRTWCTALILQLAINPQAIFNTGFQLSYLAMAGIVVIVPLLERLYPDDGGFDPIRKMWNIFSVSIGCQCFTAPLAWLKFHTFPKFFLLTNLVAMPLTTLIMFTGVPLTVLSLAGWHPQLLTTVCEGCMDILIKILELIAGMA